MNAEKYGKYYWCIKTELSQDGEIYVMGDYIQITPTGDLLVMGQGEKNTPLLAIASGKWYAFYAASVLDGHAVAVEHWKGEIAE